jgi:hypothetical protein
VDNCPSDKNKDQMNKKFATIDTQQLLPLLLNNRLFINIRLHSVVDVHGPVSGFDRNLKKFD